MNQSMNGTRALSVSLGLTALAMAMMSGSVQADTVVDACKLLTKAQVSAALGIAVDDGARPIVTEPRMCNWRESNKPTGPGRNVMVTIITEKEFERLKTLPMTASQNGIGDEAIVSHSMHVPAVLAVKAGAHCFQILVRSDLVASEEVDARNQAVEKALAEKIIKKFG